MESQYHLPFSALDVQCMVGALPCFFELQPPRTLHDAGERFVVPSSECNGDFFPVSPRSADTCSNRAKNYLRDEPKNPAPVYATEEVARAILHCAEHPMRDVTIGGGGKFITLLGNLLPRLMDKVMERTMFRAQHSGQPPRPREQHSLYDGSGRLEERGGHPGRVAESSLFTRASLHPLLATGVAVAIAGLAVASVVAPKAIIKAADRNASWTKHLQRMRRSLI